jgi:cell division protein FtsQ
MSLGLKVVFTVLPIGIIVGGIMSLVFWARQPEHFPLRAVELQQELKWTSQDTLSEVVSNFMSGGFFGLNVEDVQQQLALLPWTASVTVRRIWPDRISVHLTEQNPLARFGEKGVISTEGKVFYPDSESLKRLPKSLPLFKGPENYAKDMLQNYFRLMEMLSPLALTISELSFSPEGSLQIRLDNGIAIIIGKSALEQRVNRFVKVYPTRLRKELDKIVYLDLRYPHGIAIGWKEEKVREEIIREKLAKEEKPVVERIDVVKQNGEQESVRDPQPLELFE